jgi:hypothetical protein
VRVNLAQTPSPEHPDQCLTAYVGTTAQPSGHIKLTVIPCDIASAQVPGVRILSGGRCSGITNSVLGFSRDTASVGCIRRYIKRFVS